MTRSSLGRILLAAFAAFVFSALYYGLVVGTAWRELSGTTAADMAMWQPLAQFGRNIAVAAALAFVFRKAQVTELGAAFGLTLVLWLGFQAMAIAGSVIHEQYPLALYAIHTLDQLGAMLVMTFCLAFRAQRRPLEAAIPAGEH